MSSEPFLVQGPKLASEMGSCGEQGLWENNSNQKHMVLDLRELSKGGVSSHYYEKNIN